MADLQGHDPAGTAPETVGHMIHIPGRDGTFKAYFAPAAGGAPAPCVLVCQEIFGINHEMRRICETLSQMGYTAICPDLFWRIDPGIELDPTKEPELQKAFDLFGKFDIDKGVQDIQDTITHARTLKETTARVGAIGYCLGGLLAFLTACRTDADCAVGYYGVNIDKFLPECKGITKPLILHIAGDDQFVSKEQQEAVIHGLQGNAHVTTYHYPGAPHAFARQTDSGHYRAEAATEANRRTEDLLRKHLQGA
jgi:carboxymethylenebutenolidase